MSRMTKPTRTDDLVEIQQLLAKYAVTITQGDIDGLVTVFTPDGTYSAFGVHLYAGPLSRTRRRRARRVCS